ncbi:MAG: hypothetical protein QM757_14675 [Paludibaculum sp.]
MTATTGSSAQSSTTEEPSTTVAPAPSLSTTSTPALLVPGPNDTKAPAAADTGLSPTRKLALVVAGLIGLAVVLAILTFMYWRHTRPVWDDDELGADDYDGRFDRGVPGDDASGYDLGADDAYGRRTTAEVRGFQAVTRDDLEGAAAPPAGRSTTAVLAPGAAAAAPTIIAAPDDLDDVPAAPPASAAAPTGKAAAPSPSPSPSPFADPDATERLVRPAVVPSKGRPTGPVSPAAAKALAAGAATSTATGVTVLGDGSTPKPAGADAAPVARPLVTVEDLRRGAPDPVSTGTDVDTALHDTLGEGDGATD